MKIKELIKRLQQEDPDKKVLLNDGYNFLEIKVIGSPAEWFPGISLNYELSIDDQDSLIIGA